jgi:hypothetical protein
MKALEPYCLACKLDVVSSASGLDMTIKDSVVTIKPKKAAKCTAPVGFPPAVTDTMLDGEALNQAEINVGEALNEAEMNAGLQKLGSVPVSAPDQFSKPVLETKEAWKSPLSQATSPAPNVAEFPTQVIDSEFPTVVIDSHNDADDDEPVFMSHSVRSKGNLVPPRPVMLQFGDAVPPHGLKRTGSSWDLDVAHPGPKMQRAGQGPQELPGAGGLGAPRAGLEDTQIEAGAGDEDTQIEGGLGAPGAGDEDTQIGAEQEAQGVSDDPYGESQMWSEEFLAEQLAEAV